MARVLSKQGLASRTLAAQWVRDGRVRVNGNLVLDPEFPVVQGHDRVAVDGLDSVQSARRVIMLNKPRGLVTTTHDEAGRDTVYRCFAGANLPWLAPVGRLDKASEGLLLFSNDPVWAAGVTHPSTGLEKTYHVQVDHIADDALLAALQRGTRSDGELLRAKSVTSIRSGVKNSWLEVVLDEGRNRQIRRLLAAFDLRVIRLVRIAIGALALADLPKGAWRELEPLEVASFKILG